ncbi:copper chaperone PCu(A)C [Vibrio sp. YMD68]|uniref:copper chaperone PCu(A)C n=1 Tax=Vibrio sp. YMD68 TaxID=3042300 RepID=UPI00249C96F6|nr:copper chaperone PCu(A)C [Vibrio sp. YMD68]WGV98477.1 copper chaperone PCu(A)C [Vibrio sp. YMD68]
MKLNALLLCSLILSPIGYASAEKVSSDQTPESTPMDVMVHHAYARATPPNAVNSAVFTQLMNKGNTDRILVSASTNAAGKVELHDVITEGDMMKMRQIDEIKIPANDHVELKPGSLHIMLFDLKAPLIEGEAIEVNLTFKNGEQQVFTAPVKKVMSGMKHH